MLSKLIDLKMLSVHNKDLHLKDYYSETRGGVIVALGGPL